MINHLTQNYINFMAYVNAWVKDHCTLHPSWKVLCTQLLSWGFTPKPLHPVVTGLSTTTTLGCAVFSTFGQFLFVTIIYKIYSFCYNNMWNIFSLNRPEAKVNFQFQKNFISSFSVHKDLPAQYDLKIHEFQLLPESFWYIFVGNS